MMKRKGLKHDVLAYVASHPGAPAAEVASALRTTVEYIRATAQRNGIKLARAYPYHGGTVALGPEIVHRLEPHASVRDLSVAELIRRLVGTIADENMVDAILDDREAA